MFTDGKKWHYLSLKRLPVLFREKKSKHVGNFYCINCFHSYTTENKFNENKQHENVSKNQDYCYVGMSKQHNKILKYNPGEKYVKVPFIIYADLESLLEKISTCHNNPKKSSTTKIRSIQLLVIHYYYRDQNCMKKFYKDLKNMQKKQSTAKKKKKKKKKMIP